MYHAHYSIITFNHKAIGKKKEENPLTENPICDYQRKEQYNVCSI